MTTKVSTNGKAVPSREPFWRRTIAQQLRSGLSQSAFCRRKGLSAGTLAWWKQELKRRDQRRRLPRKPTFVPVRVVANTPPVCVYEIELRNRRRVRVGPGFDVDALRRLVAALEEPAC